jgi:hypothetical protein
MFMHPQILELIIVASDLAKCPVPLADKILQNYILKIIVCLDVVPSSLVDVCNVQKAPAAFVISLEW